MTGKYHIKIRNKYVAYEFEVKRKYTIIRGDSATGKTYMVRLLNSNVTEIKCEVEISVLPNSNWDILLREVHNQIFVIDEDFEDMKNNKFIEAMNRSDNYFILITRQELKGLAYSIEEIYNLDSQKKYNNMESYTACLKDKYRNEDIEVKPDLMIIEDSNAGFEFYKDICDKSGVKCISAEGKDKVKECIRNNIGKYDKICAIVDGAAFGACIDSIITVFNNKINNSIFIIAPESFEYLMLRCIPHICDKKYLTQTYDYCDEKYLRGNFEIYKDDNDNIVSWEQFYTKLIQALTFKDENLRYSKRKLNKKYLKFKGKVLKMINVKI